MAVPTIEYEVFEEAKPSYVQSYIMSAFALLAVIGLSAHGVPGWPPSMAHLFMILWFGILFWWMVANARERRLYLSNRMTVTAETFRHSFRYAVSEATHVEIPTAEIESVRVNTEEPRWIEVIGKNDSDVYFLPKSADVDRLVAALRAANPTIRFEE